jgi:hypothetical protein
MSEGPSLFSCQAVVRPQHPTIDLKSERRIIMSDLHNSNTLAMRELKCLMPIKLVASFHREEMSSSRFSGHKWQSRRLADQNVLHWDNG